MPRGHNASYGKAKPPLSIPKAKKSSSQSSSTGSSPVSPITPKTPADEAIEFFQAGLIPGEAPIRVYELRLDADGGPRKDRAYIRLPPAYTPYVLRVSVDAGTPAARNGVFKTNFPLDGGKFGRDRFAKRKLPSDFSRPIQIDLPISHAGAFIFWLEYDGDIPGERVIGRKGYFNIDPALSIKARSPILDANATPTPLSDGVTLKDELVDLPLDGLSILTVVSKWMGPISDWHQHFMEAKNRGYNMLHYTPLQERGESDSPYSIKDQLSYDPSLFGQKVGNEKSHAEMVNILDVAKNQYGLLSLTDVVLNHTANNTTWLIDHPEAGFSPANSPHLTPALELDSAMIEFSSSLASYGLPSKLLSETDLNGVMEGFQKVVKNLNLWQYYVLDVTREKASVKSVLQAGKATAWSGNDISGKSVVDLALLVKSSSVINGLGHLSSRFGVSADAGLAAGVVIAAFNDLDSPDDLAEAWGRIVDVLNVPLYEEWEADTKAAIENVRNRVKYTKLELKEGEITKDCPLVESYFTRIAPTPDSDPLIYSLANNGWIWAADPLQNFAELPSKAYLRREVIVWSDCVKLRYGSGPESNPWLWAHMTEYVTTLAATFDGFRIDNCHSTPLHVGVWLLDAARATNPDLYVCAELFTGNEETDLVFVKSLGVNSLIRESGNGWDPVEYSRLLYRHGVGKPIGSMDGACMTSTEQIQSPTGKGPLREAIITPLNGSMPHALLYDVTHDNETPMDKRSAEDALSTGALVTFSYCAIGSVKGFDDLYPKLLNLVTEKRKYEITQLNENSGIARIKRILNTLHMEMVLGGFVEGHVHQENDYIVLTRAQPNTGKGYVLVAHTAFKKDTKDRGYITPIKLYRSKVKFIVGAIINIKSYNISISDTLQGLPSQLSEINHVEVKDLSDHEGPYSEIVVPEYFPPGSIMVFETQLQDYDVTLDSFCTSDVSATFGDLDLVDLNVILHRAEGEERDATDGRFGAYDIPGLGAIAYCGLEGWMHPLRHIMRYNDLGHPLCSHLRSGTWAMDYVHGRLFDQCATLPNLQRPATWFQERFERIKLTVPPSMRPKYFALVISEAYKAARRAVVEQCSSFVSSGHDFTQDLALCAVQMLGQIKSASLAPSQPTPCLAAGLPHFASGWARTWGRDVFISLRGLFLTTGNFEAAKQHILAFSSTLKHGLIPNLLDSVRKPRYNSRDSPWWMLQNIQDYVSMAPEGLKLLSEPVKRRFPRDDTWVAWDDERAYAYSSTLAEIIQEILQRHADGIHFREFNAGPNLDMQMKDEGFNIDIDVDWKTGLICGGNQFNCGTWMDKMGESDRAGTRGTPGTPRDGAPVEITGLLKSTLRWLSVLSSKGEFPFKGVQVTFEGSRRLVTYQEWSDLIQASFEKCYYIPIDPQDDSKYKLDTKLINRRGIYKDVYESGLGREWSDYQLRPNFPIAMTVAPELFDDGHALDALKIAEQVLRAPLGMKTLDPSDMQYRPNYDNSNDSDDASIAKGLNYHNGPEWGWPLGYFMRAYLHFDMKNGQKDIKSTLHHLYRILLGPREHIRNDPWAGIPELTNENGQYCRDSCNSQAWSASTLLDFLEAAHTLQTTLGIDAKRG